MVQWSNKIRENGSIQCTTAAIASVLKSRSAWFVIELWLLAERVMGNRQMKIGVWFHGLGTALTGILDIAWREFDASHQPIKALGKNLPGQHIVKIKVECNTTLCPILDTPESCSEHQSEKRFYPDTIDNIFLPG